MALRHAQAIPNVIVCFHKIMYVYLYIHILWYNYIYIHYIYFLLCIFLVIVQPLSTSTSPGHHHLTGAIRKLRYQRGEVCSWAVWASGDGRFFPLGDGGDHLRSVDCGWFWHILFLFDHVMIIFNLIFMLVLWVKTPPQFGLKCAEICSRFSVTRTWEISDWGLKATIQCIGFVGVIFSGWLILPPRFTGWFAGSALTKDGILLRSSQVGWPSCLSCWLPGAKQSDPYKAFPGTFMLTIAISKVALDVVKNVATMCWG